MKIRHVITTIERGGAENQLLILAKNQVRNGHQVTVSYLKGIPELKVAFESAGIIVDNNLQKMNFFQQLFFQKKFADDLLHLHLPRSELIFAFRNSKIITISTRHNSEKFFKKFTLVSSMLSRFVTRRISKVIAISESVKKFLIENDEISDKNKIELIYYGISPEIINKNVKEKGLRFSLQKKLIIGSVARLTAQKDLDTVIRSLSILKEKNIEVKFEVIGSGEDHSFLLELSRQLNVQNEVVFLGRRDNPWIEAQKWDQFVLSSKYEGFGLVLLEAMKYSLPIVASKIDTCIEILGRDYPFFFEPSQPASLAKKIIEIVNSDFDYESLYLSKLNEFSDVKQIILHEKLYKNVCPPK